MTTNQLDHINEQELIRKYLDNSLSKEEEMVVANLYESDKDFRDALDGLEMLSADQFTKTLQSVSDKIDNKIRSAANLSEITIAKTDNVRQLFASGSSTRRLAIAASMALFLLFGGVLFNTLYQSPVDGIYADSFIPKPHPDFEIRGDNESLSHIERLSVKSYNAAVHEEADYGVAIDHFRELFTEYPENEKYGLFLGISLMGNEDFKEAIEIFEGLKVNAQKYPHDINWYLALSYLKVKKIDAAKELLLALSEQSDSYYQTSATDLLKHKKFN